MEKYGIILRNFGKTAVVIIHKLFSKSIGIKPLALSLYKASGFRVNNKNATKGDGYTQFGRAMYELNIQTICAETSSAKGRVERAHLTLLN
ncbi:hypothetical protein XBKB1_2370014 [Xenorhabdus bovienii str. kraussei Becker Underwood]|uniref:Transposase n=1 Tax=Xenorhabdus bovienii str. kraussei Becker Underwood TaxID=1398204 RepID=A0A077PW55_XENBV|nr:hypothetical protein XBKB1_2370014 [Xenorhabdus bovienii str. kraussei Becker Underwood]